MRVKEKNESSSLKYKKNKFAKLGKKIFPTKSTKESKIAHIFKHASQRKLLHLKLDVANVGKGLSKWGYDSFGANSQKIF